MVGSVKLQDQPFLAEDRLQWQAVVVLLGGFARL